MAVKCKKCNDTQWVPDKFDYDGDNQYPCSACRTERCLRCLDSGTYYSRGNGYGSGHGTKVCDCDAGIAYAEAKEYKKNLSEYKRLKKKIDKYTTKLAKRDAGESI